MQKQKKESRREAIQGGPGNHSVTGVGGAGEMHGQI